MLILQQKVSKDQIQNFIEARNAKPVKTNTKPSVFTLVGLYTAWCEFSFLGVLMDGKNKRKKQHGYFVAKLGSTINIKKRINTATTWLLANVTWYRYVELYDIYGVLILFQHFYMRSSSYQISGVKYKDWTSCRRAHEEKID